MFNQKDYTREYHKSKYSRVALYFDKDVKEALAAHCKERGIPLATYCKEAALARYDQEKDGIAYAGGTKAAAENKRRASS